MKKLIFLTLTITILFMIIGSRCKPKADTRPYGPQYEEDPGPERGTTAERLEGIWRIEDYLRNDTSIINQPSVASSGTINIKDVYWECRKATKDNGWYEKSAIYPWERGAFISNENISFDGYAISFCYWFTNPLIQSDSIKNKAWKITKLYQGSIHLKLITSKDTYRIYWKKNYR